MSRKLTARSTLETLKKEVKRWLRALQAGDVDARRRLLAAAPAAAAEPGLRDVQFALAPRARREIAQLLLDHGADPNARWIGPWGEPAFTVLTGVIGQGEGDQPPHPQARDLAALLIERGARSL
jgi:uncharacterized protein